MSIKQGDIVLAHLELKLKDGTIAESTRAGKPTRFFLGDGSLSEKIEAEFVGLTVGAKKIFSVEAEEAFGEHRASLVQHMQRHMFASDMDVSVGSIIAFENPAGGEMPGVVTAVLGDSITIDFNHPLAGQRLTFDIEIVAINP